jgi:putative DNA primase/helicase
MTLPEVPEKPTKVQRDAALQLIIDKLLGEVAFASRTDRSHALALLLLPFVRALIDGPTPLHPIDAPTPGTGKGLLAEVLLYPALGDALPVMPELGDDEEMRKRLTSIFLAGYPVVLFDNVQGRVDSAALSAALTTRTWSDRVLGMSRTANVPVTQVWVMTGNNIDYSPEMARRLCPIRLDVTAMTKDANVAEHPWRRKIKREQPLREWAEEHRGELVAAALTVVRSWQAVGSPEWTGKPLGSFERWSKVMGGIIEHCGGTGFLSNLEVVYDQVVSERDQKCRFVETWATTYGAQLVTTEQLDLLSLTVGDIFSLDGAKGTARSSRIGHGLKKMRDQTWCGYRVTKVGRAHQLVKLNTSEGGDA